MLETRKGSKAFSILGFVLLAVGLAVFAVRLIHSGPYSMPLGGPLYAALGALLLGGVLVWGKFRVLSWIALLVSPLLLFPAIYSIAGESEEVISLRSTDSAEHRVNLRLWIVDREDGAWVGMSKAKAVEHDLHGAQLRMLRAGEDVCVVPVLHEDRPTVRAIHGMKVEKYAVAQFAGAIGIYPVEAPDTTIALRLDPCSDQKP
jgi:hypothetical protein